MKENRTVAKWFAGLLVVGTIAVGGMAPAQAKDSGWNPTVAPSKDPAVTSTSLTTTSSITPTMLRDSGWNPT
jgi:hypothetical protein